LPRVEKVMVDRSYAAAIAADAEIADDFMVVGTPYFFVNGRRAQVTPTLDKVRSAVDEALKQAESDFAKGVPRDGYYERTIASGRGGLPLEIKKFPMLTVNAPTRGG